MYDLPDGYDLDHLDMAITFCKERRTAVDVGAHRGIWTQELLRHFDYVYSFEPQQDNFNRLEKINPRSFNVALGEKTQWVSIDPGEKNTGQYHVGKGEVVEWMDTLDSFYMENVDFIKIDVEGYELFVLKGGERTITDNHPVICLEMNGLSKRYGVMNHDITDWLKDRGYKCVEEMDYDFVYSHSPLGR